MGSPRLALHDHEVTYGVSCQRHPVDPTEDLCATVGRCPRGMGALPPLPLLLLWTRQARPSRAMAGYRNGHDRLYALLRERNKRCAECRGRAPFPVQSPACADSHPAGRLERLARCGGNGGRVICAAIRQRRHERALAPSRRAR